MKREKQEVKKTVPTQEVQSNAEEVKGKQKTAPKPKPVKEPKPKKEKPVKEPKPKKEKPVKEKPVKEPKPKKEKPVKEPKQKKEKPVKTPKYRKHWWQFWRKKAPKQVEEQQVPEIQEEIPIPDIDIDIEAEQREMQEQLRRQQEEKERAEAVKAKYYSAPMPEVDTESDIMKHQVVLGGFRVTLKSYISSLSATCQKVAKDSMPLNTHFGDAVVASIDFYKPAFSTEVKRFKTGSLTLAEACTPVIKNKSSIQCEAHVSMKERYIKAHTLIVGILKDGSPYISQGMINPDGETLFGKFPAEPAVVAILTIEPKF